MTFKARIVAARLQPYGLQHQAVAANNAARGGELFIAIGSAQKSHSRWNPFSFSERREMVRRSLEAANIEATIIGLRDFGDNEKWIEEMLRLVGCDKEDVVVSSRNLYTQNACRENGVAVYEHPVFLVSKEFPDGLSASITRRRIALGQEWTHLVPVPVAEYLMGTIDGNETGVERLRKTEAMESFGKEPCRPEPE